MEQNLSSSEEAVSIGHMILLRHGQTSWSQSGQHTGRTDLPLTEVGKQQALEAGERLRCAFPQGFEAEYVFSSPLQRARETAILAGFKHPHDLPDIAEWDYGRAEGRSRSQIRALAGWDWDLWADGPQSLDPSMEGHHEELLPTGQHIAVSNGSGETLEEVAVRAKNVTQALRPVIEAGHNVLLVAHAHILRILATQWLEVDPAFAKHLRMDTAHFSVLGGYKGDNVIEHWND
ncbi:histidine phosphatase family protein [Bifidobacterium aemilianum]|uniref:phosphoglycerate mutase (2,3-diphosphoglycerate-dependent) n=1 Tax=Bifidobacterium aemilianum TaxID=2493120 RepID=A0A366K7X8_9BIFI|nr:histidine phosphatase family protein [Bifidobacterium aemilianum]RBP97352.1 histidine phosphatase family protein [Bifidobacterium aemilianum]